MKRKKKTRKRKKEILVVRMNENKFSGKALMNSTRIRSMRLALVFKKNDDLSVAKNRGAKYSSGAKTMNLHLKTEDGTVKYENQQKNSRAREK